MNYSPTWASGPVWTSCGWLQFQLKRQRRGESSSSRQSDPPNHRELDALTWQWKHVARYHFILRGLFSSTPSSKRLHGHSALHAHPRVMHRHFSQPEISDTAVLLPFVLSPQSLLKISISSLGPLQVPLALHTSKPSSKMAPNPDQRSLDQKLSDLRKAHAAGQVVGLRDFGIAYRLDIDVLLTKQPDTFNLFLIALDSLQNEEPSTNIMGYFQIAGPYDRVLPSCTC